MAFNSISYAIFFPIVFILYWNIPSRARWFLLLISSYYFYMSWNVKYVVLILTTTAVSYACALYIEKHNKTHQKRIALIVALLVCLGILFVFKYYNWFNFTISSIFGVDSNRLNLLLPVGISFYTFQTLGYVIDVYRGEVPAEKHFGIYATFISFFPQLVAGPIERTSNLLHQIKGEHFFDYNETTYGIRLLLWGLFKKVVIADNLALIVDAVYGDVKSYHGFSLVIATCFFALQIYCDFSGYSDIARGSARMLGIKLMDNFKSPYYSSSIREFWGRWHISLSTWFRDYVYIPLGGNRCSKLRNGVNTLTTFLVSGLWHGANWSFVIWGGVHGAAQITENVLGIKKKEKRDAVWALRVFLVFFFVMLAWVFFRADTIHDSLIVFKQMFSGLRQPIAYVANGVSSLGLKKQDILRIVCIYLIPLLTFDYISMDKDIFSLIGEKRAILRHLYAILLIAVIMVFGYFGKSTFVYFQF